MSHIYLYLLSFSFLLAGCAGEEKIGGDDVDPILPEEKIAVSFSSKLYLEPETKAEGNTSDLLENVNVVIRVYKQAAVGVPTVDALIRRNYKVAANGDLTAAADEAIPIYLGADNYTFFALSVNTAGTDENTFPPELASSMSETVELKNETDYLYCAVNEKISSSPDNKATVNLTFERLAARIQITIVSEGGDDKIISAQVPTVTLPLTDPSGSKIILGGEPLINQGNPFTDQKNYTALQSTGNITDGFVADCILLPMAASTDRTLPVTILFPSITFNGLGEQTNKIYTLNIPLPADTGFASGKQYNYKVNITGNEIGFAGLTVVSWKGVNGNIPNEDMSEDQEGNK